MECTIHVAKTKALISCAVTAQLFCVFIFAYTRIKFSRAESQMYQIVVYLVISVLPVYECKEQQRKVRIITCTRT